MGDETPEYDESPLAANPENPNDPDRKMTISKPSGWKTWKTIPAETSTRLDVSELGLATDEAGYKLSHSSLRRADVYDSSVEVAAIDKTWAGREVTLKECGFETEIKW